MKKHWKKALVVIAVAFMFLIGAVAEDTYARGGRSGGFSSGRSSGFRSSSPSRSTPSKPSTSKPSTTSKSTKPSSTSRSTTPTRTATQQKSYEAAKKNGTAFSSKSQAISSFKSDPKMQTQYTSKYSTQPATRPTHIPQTYSSGGQTYNINYNSQYGGYGYMGPSGWIAYDFMTMATAAHMASAMSHHNYYYDAPMVATAHHTSAGVVLLWVLGIIVAVVIVAFLIGALGRA